MHFYSGLLMYFCSGVDTVALDPNYSDAYGLLSFSYLLGYIYQWDEDQGVLDRAADFVNKSIALNDSYSDAYAVRGWIAADKGKRDNALTDGKRAVALDPNSAFAWNMLAEINLVLGAGNSEEVLADAQKAIRLDPRHPEFYALQEGNAYSRMKRYAEAIDALKRADQNNPWAHVNLVYNYTELGREPEARAEVSELLRVSPGFSLEEVKQRMPGNWQGAGHQHFLADLRKAGLK